MASVFLSYDHEDAALAKPLVAAMEKAGHSVWFDRHIEGGAQYSRQIEQALNDADAVVVLWTPRSLESAWVRDEAADGRDRNKLIPLSAAGAVPPLGFRQFQTIDLGNWTGRGKIPRLMEILRAVERTNEAASDEVALATSPRELQSKERRRHRWLLLAGAACLVLAFLGVGYSKWRGASNLPVVQVVAADPTAQSVAVANDLFVKLGGLAQVGDGKWQLMDSSGAKSDPDLLFRTSETSTAGRSVANLVLLDGKHGNLLWSREFALPAEQEADVKQQLSLTAGRVLGCALESRSQAGLSTDLLKTFLDACASLADSSGEDYGPLTDQLRKIVAVLPGFEPAWSRLIMAEATAIEYEKFTPGQALLERRLKDDVAKARTNFPKLPALAVANVRLRAKLDYGRDIGELTEAVERAPANPQLLGELSESFQKVGRMADATNSAKRAAELDPLSPGGTTTYIMTLAHSGEIESARTELVKAEKLWAGTGALRDAQIAFHVRYGDPAIALKLDPEGYNTVAYYTARRDPSPFNIAKLKAGIDEFRPKTVTPSQVGWAIQSLGQFGLVDDIYYWLGRLTNDQAASLSYILFRPSLASARRDARFMPLAKRIGLIDYWEKSGHWPDFCGRPGIPYDCKQEAAKLK